MKEGDIRNTSIDAYEVCGQCGAGLDRLALGGDGDWKFSIHCLECDNIQDNVPQGVLERLIASKYDLTVEAVRRAEGWS